MTIFNTHTILTGTSGDDFFFGNSSGSDHDFNGGDGNDVMVGSSVNIFTDVTNANTAVIGLDLLSLTLAFASSMNIDDAANWTLQSNPLIETDGVAHTTVYASGGNGVSSNFYSVTVGAGETLTLDVDAASPNFNSELRLYTLGSLIPVASNTDSGNLDTGSLSTEDSFLTVTNTSSSAVTYLIEMDAEGGVIGANDQYLLNVSVTNHEVGAAPETEGDYTFTGGGGEDVMVGLDGDDTFVALDNDGNDVIEGGEGFNSVRYDAVTAGVTVDLNIAIAQDTGGGGIDTITNIDAVYGSLTGDDVLTGVNTGGILQGFGGNDILNGGEGDDVLSGGQGQDSVFGGGGNDRIELEGANDVEALEVYDGGDGTDTLSFRGDGNVGPTIYDLRDATTLSNFELIELDPVSDGIILQISQSQWDANAFTQAVLTDIDALGSRIEIFADSENLLDLSSITVIDQFGNDGIIDFEINGNAQDNQFIGTEFVDILIGGAGSDTINGLAGDDRLKGGTGDDTLFGGIGQDTLIGGTGDDAIDGWSGYDMVVYTGLSSGVTVDLSVTTAQDTGGGGVDTIIRVESLVGSQHDDNLTGNAGRNRLEGGNGADMISGLGDNDVIIGGNGDDTLFGDEGRDRLFGGADADMLYGGGARDRLEGGAGNDALFGGNDVDRLLGGDGDDMLTGGNGVDFLFGGAGNDTFVYNTVEESTAGLYQRDEIRDWNDGDLIDVSAVDANDAMFGDQSFNLIEGSFTGTAGEMMIQSLVRSNVNVQLVSFDVDGDAQADMQIWVIASELDADDFVL